MIPRAPGPADDRLYTARFFQVFAATMLFMTGAALQFHFGQYFEYLGHDIDTLGLVVGLSVTGTLCIRLHIGRWIDRFGCRPTWLVGALVVAVAVGSIQFVEQLWLIAVLRALWHMAFAAVMTTVAVFAAQIAPPRRRAESLGSMGLAGFTGMIVGPALGDFIFSGDTEVITPYRLFFTCSALCSLASAAIVACLPSLQGRAGSWESGGRSPAAAERVSVLRIIVRHWPGMILLVGLAFAMVFCLQQMFLERLAEARGFRDIKVFFLTYAPTAMLLRVVFRRVPERLGRTRTLVGGLLLLSAGLFCLIGIDTQWRLILPGLLMGAGHCFIFPSMVDLAAERLPPERRGMGTSLILGAGDLGLLIGFVLLGEVFDRFGFDTGLVALAVLVLASTAVFAVSRRGALLNRAKPAGPGPER